MLFRSIPISLLEIPSSDVEYVVSPSVTISGDGTDALAYCIVNNAIGSNYEITSVVPINVGSQYTNANVSITAPSLYGSGAVVSPVISPISGHGSDPISELGGKYLGVSMVFDTAINENYRIPNYGTYRRGGILYNPYYNDVFLYIGNTLRNDLTLSSVIGNFVNNEIIYQSFTGAAARVVNYNSSSGKLQIKDINGTFNTNTAIGNNKIKGLTSSTVANADFSNTLPFTTNSLQLMPVYNSNTNAYGTLVEAIHGNGYIRLSNVVGRFNVGDIVYDPSVNSYASISSIYVGNNTINIGNNFGSYFNQTSRITLSSNNGSFIVGERVIQNISNGNGLIIDTSHELDMTYNLNSGTMSVGTQLNDITTNSNGIITFANTSYIKLTGVNGSFNSGDSIQCVTGTGQISASFPVLVLSDVLNLFTTGSDYIINGVTSKATGIDIIPGTITNPDLVKNKGEVLYVNDIQPFVLNLTSQEIFQLVLTF